MTPTLDATPSPASEQEWPPLTPTERCDARAVGLDGVSAPCGAAALVRWATPSGYDLVFCGHHHNELEPGLLAQGARLVVDQRQSLRETASAR